LVCLPNVKHNHRSTGSIANEPVRLIAAVHDKTEGKVVINPVFEVSNEEVERLLDRALPPEEYKEDLVEREEGGSVIERSQKVNASQRGRERRVRRVG